MKLFLSYSLVCFSGFLSMPGLAQNVHDTSFSLPPADAATNETIATSGLQVPFSGDAVTTLPSVEQLLKRAAIAVREQSYRGRFTYEFGSALETLELVHSVTDGIEHERILHLSGKKREFLRSGRSSHCLSVGSLLLRGKSVGGESLHGASRNYDFFIGADERIAGREASLVQIVPKDEYRYGMTMAFDKQSGLPLLTLTGTSKSTLERFQFVDLHIGEVDVKDALTPVDGPFKELDSGADHCAKVSGSSSGAVYSANAEGENATGRWQTAWRPKGFVLSQAGSEEGYEEVLTYSDGLASFSVFVSDLSVDKLNAFKSGMARRGATLVLMRAMQVNGQAYGVMLVGEVPIAAAKKVLASVVPVR